MRLAGQMMWFTALVILIFANSVYAVDLELMLKASEQGDYAELQRMMKMKNRLDYVALFMGLIGGALILISFFKNRINSM